MKFFIKKVYLTLFVFLLLSTEVFGKENRDVYSKDNISNYFIGIISADKYNNIKAFNHLKKAQSIQNIHSNYNLQFIRTLVQLEKFELAFSFAKEIITQDKSFFEGNLLLGIQSLENKDYLNAERYFKRISKNFSGNFYYEDFLANSLLGWVKAYQNNKKESSKFFSEIPDRYYNLKKIQNSFFQCFFDTSKAQVTFEELAEDKSANFSRYNFFLVNYLISKNKNLEAKKAINKARKKYNSNLLIKQTNNFIVAKKSREVKNFFNCKKPKHIIAEIFYILANLYSGEGNYSMSNFYLKISFYLNNDFLSNKTLFAENLFYQKKYKESKEVYKSLRSIGESYSWYSTLSISKILLDTNEDKNSILEIKKEFDLLKNPNHEHYFEIANFYKDNKYYDESIKYYSLALNNIKKNNSLSPKILYRRGTSYERLDQWELAEKDLVASLDLLPDQPYVLNYLAYAWVEKGKNINKAIEMLKRAVSIEVDDGYIIDSLGWANYVNQNYLEAEKYLQKAVELLPLDPVINDHYADSLWMQNKNIQARYFWKNVLKLDTDEKGLKKKIKEKIIFGIK